MRFLKIFFLFSLFGFSVLCVSSLGSYAREALLLTHGTHETLSEVAQIMGAGLEGEADVLDRAMKANREFSAKVVPVLKWIWVAEIAAYLIVTFLATLLNLRFSRFERSNAS